MRPQRLVGPRFDAPRRVPPGTSAVVVGGGIAGFSAAVILAERGVRVTVLEAADHLGGRLGAWPHTLTEAEAEAEGRTGRTAQPEQVEQIVEHGFHAFFRQYYTWRSVLRRVDPTLGFLKPLAGYPVISRRWPDEDLTGLPAAPPLSLLTLFARSPSLGLRDITGADRALALELLGFHTERTTRALDDMPAGEFLDRFGITERARAMLFEAFARSFFCDPRGLSAAELVAMFHFYFLGNPEGLGFDCPDTDYRTAIWAPLTGYLQAREASVRLGAAVRSIEPGPDHGWLIDLDGEQLRARHVVLAVDPGGLRGLVERSPALARTAPRLAAQVSAVRLAPPFAVARLWLDRDVAPERAVFSAVTGEPTLDSVACYHRLETPSAQWAERTGGAVLELHSYSCTEPDAARATARMREQLAGLWPETRDARVRHELVRLEATAPAFPPGDAGRRPGVRTDARGIRVAGDFVELPWCAGLMERSAMSGVLAANDVLEEEGAGPEPVFGVPQLGLLAGATPFTRAGRAVPSTRDRRPADS